MAFELSTFGKIARELARNPLGIIALFIVLIYGFAALLLSKTAAELTTGQSYVMVLFLAIFPVIVLGIFAWLVSQHHAKLYAPRDFKSDEAFLQTLSPSEKQVADFQGTVTETKLEISEDAIDVENPEEKDQILDTDIKEALRAAEINPGIGIMRLSSLIEKDIRIIANSFGDFSTNRKMSVRRHFQLLVDKGRLPKHTTESLKIFWNLRNHIVHGHEEQDTHNVLRVLDIGLNLLRTIRSIPLDIYEVYHPGVDIFEDEECTKKHEGVKGLILEGKSSGGENYKCIFPTTKTSYYKKGKRVTWEWNLSKVWDKTWYIAPDTNEKKSAWGSAGEFIGRHVEDI